MTTKKKKGPAVAASSEPKVDDTCTLGFLASEYVQHLEAIGKSAGTVSSYGMEMKSAVDEMGKDTPLAIITEDWVRTYFESDRVTKMHGGRAKAKPTVDKTRRVLRLALTWAVEKGWIPSAPIPVLANKTG